MAEFIPFSELPTRDVITRRVDGTEPDVVLAHEMMEAEQKAYAHNRIIWDVMLPPGADDRNRIELNVSRMGRIRVLGQYSVIRFIDVSNQEPSSLFMGDDPLTDGILIGLNIDRMASWALGRYYGLLPIVDVADVDFGQDVVVADELEDTIGYTLQEASRELSPVRQRAVVALAKLPGLVRTKPRE